MKEVSFDNLKQFLKDALVRHLPGAKGHEKMMPYHRDVSLLEPSKTARRSGVLIAIFPDELRKPTIILIKRSNDGGKHAGQIALPGGKMEIYDETIVHTALREAKEEVSLESSLVEPVGLLSPLYVSVSDFLMQPVVAFLEHKPSLLKSDLEVDKIIDQQLFSLFKNKDFDAIIHLNSKNQEFMAPAYRLDNGELVWGATAMVLAELEVILLGDL